MSYQKKLTKDFFNKVAEEWFYRTYDPKGTFFQFPGNRVRMEVVLGEIEKLGLGGRMLDVGCGAGQLVIELLKKGNGAVGIDIAGEMIARAKVNLLHSKISADPGTTFYCVDLAHFKSPKKYDAVTALGLLEYLERDSELFSMLNKIVMKGGYVFAECRNRFFNLFSMNDYTPKILPELPKLIKELKEAEKYSPIPAEKAPLIQAKVTKEITKFLNEALKKKEWFAKNTPVYSGYPKKMVRRQHTPQELEKTARKFGFGLEYVIYWHLHPYPPFYEKKFPRIFNKMSYLTAPLGRTIVGAYMSSSFIGILRKR